MTPERQAIVECARRYLGTPFKYAGRSRRGLDCIALGLLAARDLRMAGWKEMWRDPEVMAYPRIRPPGFMRAKLDQYVANGWLRSFPISEMQGGDMILRFGAPGHDHHVSLLSVPGQMIEARLCYPRRVVECTIVPDEYRTFLRAYQFAAVA